MNLLILAIIFMFTTTVFLLILGTVQSRKNKILERLDSISQVKEKKQKPGEVEELEKPFFERIIRPYISKIAERFSRPKASVASTGLDERLLLAGNPGKLVAGEFRAIQLLAALILFGLAGLICVLFKAPLPFLIAFTAAGVGLGFVVPKFYLGRLISKRQKAVRKGLPDCLDLLCVSVEAGLGFDMALGRVVEKFRGPLSDEFKKALDEITVGRPRKDALKDASKRCGVDDLEMFINAIVQAEQLGIAIANVLRIQAGQMRTRRRQKIEELAMKAPLKMLFPMVFFIFPTIFIVVLGPVVLKVITELSGKGI
ncbi:MAG: type II secretion system F family protein [bacterium]